jgi:hypothetical protein
MIDELYIAAAYSQRVIVRLSTGETIMGKAQLSGVPGKAKIRTSDGPVWIPHEDIEHVERLVNVH